MGTAHGRILVVDDDRDILTASRLLLRRRFAEVVLCSEPEEIPGLLRKHQFDAVLLDMNFGPGESSGRQGLAWLELHRHDAVVGPGIKARAVVAGRWIEVVDIVGQITGPTGATCGEGKDGSEVGASVGGGDGLGRPRVDVGFEGAGTILSRDD